MNDNPVNDDPAAGSPGGPADAPADGLPDDPAVESAAGPARRSSAGIVLAGGRSTRFGTDKLVALIEGRSLLLRAIEAVAAACGEVIVVTAAGGPASPVDVRGLPVPLRWAEDRVAGRGPLAGLLAGLEETAASMVIVVGGDMPGLVPAVLALLLDRLGPGVEAAVLADGNALRPLPAALDRAAALAVARALTSNRPGLRDLLARLRTEVVAEVQWRLVDPAGSSLLDVDRPEDLARLGVAPPR